MGADVRETNSEIIKLAVSNGKVTKVDNDKLLKYMLDKIYLSRVKIKGLFDLVLKDKLSYGYFIKLAYILLSYEDDEELVWYTTDILDGLSIYLDKDMLDRIVSNFIDDIYKKELKETIKIKEHLRKRCIIRVRNRINVNFNYITDGEKELHSVNPGIICISELYINARLIVLENGKADVFTVNDIRSMDDIKLLLHTINERDTYDVVFISDSPFLR